MNGDTALLEIARQLKDLNRTLKDISKALSGIDQTNRLSLNSRIRGIVQDELHSARVGKSDSSEPGATETERMVLHREDEQLLDI